MPDGTVNVSATDMWYTRAGRNYIAYTTVTIVDETGSAVSHATVALVTTLGGGSTSTDSGTTGTDGSVTFSVKSKMTGTYRLEVTDVSHSSLTYEPADNVETSESLTVP